MSNKTKQPGDYSHITPELIAKVNGVIAQANKHTYSTSRVYGAHNAVFKLNDQPQNCSSCLRNRVRDLRMWLKGYYQDNPEALVTPSKDLEKLLADFLAERGITNETEPGAFVPAAEEFLIVHGHAMTADERGHFERAIGDAREAALAVTEEGSEDQYEDPAVQGYIAPADGVIRHPMGEDILPFDFTPSAEDPNKGTVVNADGSKVDAGTYVTAAGTEITVNKKGGATIKAVDEDLT